MEKIKIAYEKPTIDSVSDEMLWEMIVAGASCPLCYNGCNYVCW